MSTSVKLDDPQIDSSHHIPTRSERSVIPLHAKQKFCFVPLAGLILLGCLPCFVSAAEKPLEFARDVVPALTKAGCNAGKCHGSFQGRGGFRLSLFGFDPLYDFEALVSRSRGRRISPAAPSESLIIRKPSGILPHGGGQVITPDSAEYQLLIRWLSEGIVPPSPADPQVTKITVEPAEVRLTPGTSHPIQVRAEWSDGVTRDVTSWALYESREENFATVSRAGEITALEPGRTALTVSYMGQVRTTNITVPYPESETNKIAEFQPKNFIDELILAEWKKIGIEPAPLASDEEFLRRVYIDLIGTLPTSQEIRDFLKSEAPNKRENMVDTLLNRPEYVDYWTIKWGDLLRIHRRYLGDKGLENFRAWVRTNLRENRPVNEIVHDLLTAKGDLYSNGPVAFYFTDTKPENFTETTAQIFLGMRIQCAKCHHHPYEVWSQEDYYSLAAFFTRFEVKDNGDGGRFGGARMIRPTDKANRDMRPQMVVEPKLFGLKLEDEDLSGDIRTALADWITSPKNDYFARNFTNRYWADLMGRGLVEPVDDLRDTNPPSHPALMEALEKEFVSSGYDAKHLLRTICASRTYQLRSELNPERDADGKFYSHRKMRRLSAEVLLDSISQATGVTEQFAGVPKGTRAIALADPSIASYFLDAFGRPARNDPCECARGTSPNLAQALHMANGDEIHGKITNGQGRLAKLFEQKIPLGEIVDELYLATYSRFPTETEKQRAIRLIGECPSPQAGCEDLMWALLNSSQFQLNH